MNEPTTIESLMQRSQETAPPVLKTGEKAGRFTFLGIDAEGGILCRCECGTVEATTARLLGSILKAPSRHRVTWPARMRCKRCREFVARLAGRA